MTLSELFDRCLTIPYTQVGAADYAFWRQGDTLYVFFQGSDGRVDWQRNLDFPARAYRRMGRFAWFAHRGFLRAFKELEDALAPSVADPSLDSIVSVGFSHGAALALLFHEYVWYHRPDLRPRIQGYGFGCPRVLWGHPCAAVRARWERFTLVQNRGDLVTHLPPALLGYTHAGRTLHIGRPFGYNPIDAHRPENIARELHRLEAGEAGAQRHGDTGKASMLSTEKV